MRDLLSLVLIGAALGIAASPALAGEAPHCALDAPSAVIKVADQPMGASRSAQRPLPRLRRQSSLPQTEALRAVCFQRPRGRKRFPF